MKILLHNNVVFTKNIPWLQYILIIIMFWFAVVLTQYSSNNPVFGKACAIRLMNAHTTADALILT